MRKVALAVLCLALLASGGLVSAGCGGGEDLTVTWKAATYSLAGDPLTDLWYDYADLLAEESDGRLELKLFPGGTLYTMSQMFDAVSTGAVDMCCAPLTYFITQCPKTVVILTYPNFVFTDTQTIVDSQKALIEEMSCIGNESAANDIMYAMWQFPSNCNFYFNKPVDSLADIAGMKMGCPGGMGKAAVAALGASPVELDASQFYEAAQSGLVDGIAFVPLDVFVNLKVYDLLPYVVLYNLASAFPAAINTDSFNKLTEDLQEIVSEAADEIEVKGVESYLEVQDDLLETLGSDPDVNVYTLPPAERAVWTARVVAVLDGMLTRYLTAAEITEMHTILDRYE